jgi:hypothetical protein
MSSPLWIVGIFQLMMTMWTQQRCADVNDMHYSTLHEFHNSIAELNYNTKNNSFEVSLRVFTDDFETALTQANNLGGFHLDNTKKHNAIIEKYLHQHFYLKDNKNQKIVGTFIGKEIENEATWLYYEIPLKKSLIGWYIHNSILTELFEDQMNMVNIFFKKQKKTLLFKQNNTYQKLALE